MDPEVFGAFIQTRRKELGLNQTQLAEKLHVTAKAVSRWERGVGFPSIELLQPLSEALEISIAELMQSKLPALNEKNSDSFVMSVYEQVAPYLVTDCSESDQQYAAPVWWVYPCGYGFPGRRECSGRAVL